ncbi:unnamed protein product [Malus baccata var. baccata]
MASSVHPTLAQLMRLGEAEAYLFWREHQASAALVLFTMVDKTSGVRELVNHERSIWYCLIESSKAVLTISVRFPASSGRHWRHQQTKGELNHSRLKAIMRRIELQSSMTRS